MALLFHNVTILLSAWVGFIIGRRTLEMDEMEKFLQRSKNWRGGGS